MTDRSFSDEVELRGETMPHALGQWPGTRPKEWTLRHKHTGFKVVWNEADLSVSQHRMRAVALLALEMMVRKHDE